MTGILRQPSAATACLPTFFLLSLLHVLYFTSGYFGSGIGDAGSELNALFHIAAWPLYSMLYLAPAVALTLATRRFLRAHQAWAAVVAVLMTSVTLLLIRVDGVIYELYAFHINSFVLNLLMTPGGLGSLGSGAESYLSFVLVLVRILLIQSALLLLARHHRVRRRCRHPGYWRLAGVLAGLFAVQGMVYGVSDVANYGPVLDSSHVYPLFQRVRFRSFAARFGFEHHSRSGFFAEIDTAPLAYPRTPIAFAEVAHPPNIVLLVAESLRWDQLTPQTMPNTWQASGSGQRFMQHYSSGNGTREGLFGLFYGLYGSYWSSFMHAGRPPLLMERVRQLDYQLDLRTSAAFTYPEFDRTLFSGVPAQQLHEADSTLPPWQRDALNTDAWVDFLRTRDAARPFLSFFFFESTHASYSFAEDGALTADYQEGVDYTQLSRAELAADITPLYNRYRNAAHWVDLQLGRIYAELERQELLDDTIVIITGDHGEEFMEKGAWGHNSSFVEEQTHVPLVVLMPGRTPAVIDRLTSHVDIATTLLQMLGAPPDSATYSLGANLLDTPSRDHVVVSDWHSLGVVTADFKYRIPYLVTAGANYWPPTNAADRVLEDAQATLLTTQYRDLLLQAMAACTLFSARPRDSSGVTASRLDRDQ